MKLLQWSFCCILLGHVGAVGTEDNQEVISRLEKSLLNMFGLKEKPQVDASTVKIPAHMMRLYKMRELQEKLRQKRVLQENGEELPDEEPQKETGVDNTINIHGNTVRSYSHIESTKDKSQPSHAIVLRFNVSSLPAKESLRHVELRLSHAVHSAAPAASGEPKRRKYSRNELGYLQRVNVYEVLKPARGSQDQVSRLLDTKVVDSRTRDSLSFDVVPAVSRWNRQPKSNYGLFVEVIPIKAVPESPFRDGKNVRLRRSPDIAIESDEWSEEQPLLVVHTDDESLVSREKRSPPPTVPFKRPLCKRHQLKVDFRKVEWNNWIVAPPGYEAFYCQGECPYPLPSHMNATNHAVIQNIIHSRYPDRVPSACCVPIKHSAISMLYLDTDTKVVLKTYQDMIVESCGCQ